jgi:hypothetical protein
MYCYCHVHGFVTGQYVANAVFAVVGDVSLKLDKAARRQSSFYRFSVSAVL